MMVFTLLGRIVCVLGLILGVGYIFVGFTIEPGSMELGGIPSGQWKDKGIYIILLSIALGTLTDISVHANKILSKIQPPSVGGEE